MTLVAIIAAVGLIQAPTIEMSITSDGTEVGKAWLTQKVESGAKKTYAKLILGDVRIVETAEYSLDGTPKAKVLTRTVSGKVERTEATFGTGAVRLISGGQVTTIPLPAKGSLQAKSEFWFLQAKPPVNHTIEYLRLDLNERKFVPCKVTYIGKEQITLGGKQVAANRVRVDGKTDAWLDDRGDPYRMVISGGTRFERVVK